MTEAEARTLSFKVDLLWKIIILGLVTLAARMSWKAWEDTQDTIRYLVETVGDHETRITVNEFRSRRNESDIGGESPGPIPRPSK